MDGSLFWWTLSALAVHSLTERVHSEVLMVLLVYLVLIPGGKHCTNITFILLAFFQSLA